MFGEGETDLDELPERHFGGAAPGLCCAPEDVPAVAEVGVLDLLSTKLRLEMDGASAHEVIHMFGLLVIDAEVCW